MMILDLFKTFAEENKFNSFSQDKQDLFILFLENKMNGYFVEFGACDGIFLSNTYLLEKDYNWTGILAEPVPSYFEELLKNRKVHLDQHCIADASDQELIFAEVDLEGDKGLSGIRDFILNDLHAEIRQDNAQYYKVKTLSLNDLLDKYNAPEVIDYLSIDTEGSEFAILQNFNFKRIFNIITVEHNNTELKMSLRRLLMEHDYLVLEQDICMQDDWYLHKNYLRKIKKNLGMHLKM